MIKTKKQMFIVIGAFALILLLGTASYAFFNYTRTGGENTVGIGRIYFNTDQGNDTLTLTNIFPMTSTQANTANLDSVAVHIQGDTTYNDGEEFEITLVNVTNTVNGKTIPINYTATYTATTNKGIGTESSSYSDYFTDRGSSSSKYTLEETGEVSEGKQVLVGFIPKDGEVDGTLTIKAYIDSSKVVISDTLENGAIEVTGYNNGYPNPGEGATVLTTSEWNALEGAGTLKFSVRGIANEGTWVPTPPPANGQELAARLTETNAAGNKIYTGANVANYVTFNGEPWRIIGVYGDKLKIVKATPLEGTQKWQNSASDGNTWNGSRLETYLNTTYYSSLNETAQNMIAEGSWDVGTCGYEIAASDAYTCASTTKLTGADTNSNRVKVGLVATYEYLYAAENTCWATSGYDYGNGSTCNQQDWLYGALTYNGSSRAWTLSPSSGNARSALIVISDGYVNSGYLSIAYAASPVVYLNPNVKITGGDGTTPQTAYTLSYTAS